jgi:putative DNA primase/helicase
MTETTTLSGVPALAIGNPILMVSIGTMLASPAAPFLPYGGAYNALIHFYEGRTYELGKSTSLYAGASVWGPGLVQQWNMTLNVAEHVFGQHNNVGIALDNGGAVLQRDLKKIAKVFAAGESANPPWSLFGLGEGPFPIDAPCIVNVPFPADAFVDLHGFANTWDFANAIAAAARTHYGVAGPAFVRWLLDHQDEACDRLCDLFFTEVKFGSHDNLLRPIAACAALAADVHVIPWSADEMLQALVDVAKLARGR